MESLSISWALFMWLMREMIETCVGSKEPHREVSLLVETVMEDNRTNSIGPSVCHSIDTAISMSPTATISEYKNSVSKRADFFVVQFSFCSEMNE
jgi:hypothetical protein